MLQCALIQKKSWPHRFLQCALLQKILGHIVFSIVILYKKYLATSFSAVCYYTKNTWPHRFLQCALIQKTLGHIVFCSVLLYKIHLATSFSAVCSYTKNTWPHCFLQCALIQKNTLSYRFPLGITIPTTAVNIDHQLTYLVLSWR